MHPFRMFTLQQVSRKGVARDRCCPLQATGAGNTGLTIYAAYIVQAQRYLLKNSLTRDWTPEALRRQLSIDFVVQELLPAVTRPSSLIKGS